MRFRLGAEWKRGRVVRSRPLPLAADEEVTVRLAAAGAIEFRFVRRSAVEPVDATAAECADQATGALRSGKTALAALWIAHGHCRGYGDDVRIAAVARRVHHAGLTH